jgi:hypothetical protein
MGNIHLYCDGNRINAADGTGVSSDKHKLARLGNTKPNITRKKEKVKKTQILAEAKKWPHVVPGKH